MVIFIREKLSFFGSFLKYRDFDDSRSFLDQDQKQISSFLAHGPKVSHI